MKKISKLLALLMALAMVFALAACSGDNGNADNTASGNQPGDTQADDNQVDDNQNTEPATDGETYTIGICQLVQHPALDLATQGFKDALTEKLGADAIDWQEGNASGESTNCATIINDFLSSNVDLILANATAPLQAAAAATAEIPVLGTSVTDYATALEIDDWNGTVGTNVSGTSDLAPLDQQAAMIQEIFPDAETVGLLYCSGEPNSVYQCTVIEGYLKDMGYNVEWFAFTDTNDLSSVTQAACDSSDVIYIPTDNTAANNTEAIANVVLPAGVPVMAGEEGICSGCGAVTLSISYYDIGYRAGEMAYEILVNGADVSTMAVEYAPEVVKEYNAANCEALNITVPEDYVAIEG